MFIVDNLKCHINLEERRSNKQQSQEGQTNANKVFRTKRDITYNKTESTCDDE